MSDFALPIHVEGSEPSNGFNCFWLKNSHGDTFGDIYGPQSLPDQQAIAILIVEAVNSYATLKARIEELEGALRKIRSGTENIYQIANDALEAKHD